ncbi:MAG: ATP-binding protein [Myxococcota bacterium]|nr:ATP-binding protein [Myxococcota bacterium]
MTLPGTDLTAIAAVELLATLLLGLWFARRPAERELGLAAAVGMVAATHAIATLTREPGVVAPRLASWAPFIASTTLTLSAPLVFHCALLYRAVRPPWRALGAYGVAALLGVPVALLELIQMRGRPAWISPDLFSIATVAWLLAGSLTAGAALLMVSRACLRGRREALGLVVGGTVFLACMVNDAAVASGFLAAYHLADVGLAAFVIGAAATPSARYAILARDLDLRTRELRTRTRELQRSNEELRAAEEELAKKEQLAVVGELAAVIAHEVRNPLAIIANAVAGLRRQVISREDHVTLLAILDEETSRLNRLVTDLLRYARPVSVQRTQFSLADLLERTLGLATTRPKGIRVELKLECDEGRLWGDANLLRQVFDNLVDNAIQAMSVGGMLTVRVHPASEEGVDGLSVDIIDTGEGMDTQVRSRARDPFFTTRPSGTGLGLAIVDRIVEAHGGHLAIESRAGEGTTVTVFLPHGSPSEPPPPCGAAVGWSDPRT